MNPIKKIKEFKEVFADMKKLNDTVLKLLAKTAYASAKKEANSACLCLNYQPKMPEKVRELKARR